MPQLLAKIYIHAIFSTKNREPVLADEWRDQLFHVLGGAANNLGCQSMIVGGVADHVHMLFQMGRTVTIADAVGKIKSTSSAWVNQTRKLAMPFHWQRGVPRCPIPRPPAPPAWADRTGLSGRKTTASSVFFFEPERLILSAHPRPDNPLFAVALQRW